VKFKLNDPLTQEAWDFLRKEVLWSTCSVVVEAFDSGELDRFCNYEPQTVRFLVDRALNELCPTGHGDYTRIKRFDPHEHQRIFDKLQAVIDQDLFAAGFEVPELENHDG